MTSPRRTVGRALLVLLAAVAASATTAPSPGTVNYLEADATLDGAILPASSAGSAAMGPNQVLDTAGGKAEILLTPGVFLRLGDDSELRMISPQASAVELLRGEAILEVGQLVQGTGLSVLMEDAAIDITETGLYVLDAEQRSIGVVTGQAAVRRGDARIVLAGGQGVLLGEESMSTFDLDMDVIESDPLYAWSNARSDSLSQADLQSAQAFWADSGSDAGGWFWDASAGCYAFVPAAGIVYRSPGPVFDAPGVLPKTPRGPAFHDPSPKRPPAPVTHPGGGRGPSAAPVRSAGGFSGGGHAGGGGGGHVGGGGGGGHAGGGGHR